METLERTRHPRISLTLLMLKAYYASVQPLRTYLVEVLRPEDAHLILESHEGGPDAYTHLLDTSLVAIHAPPGQSRLPRRCSASSPLMPMREVIDRSMAVIFKKGKGRPNNVLTSGYRTCSRNGNSHAAWETSRPGIENYFVNTLVTALQSPPWERLFQIVGVDAILHVLTETSVFVALPNDCLCQMTGTPILYTKPPELPFDLGRSATGSPLSNSQGLKRKCSEPCEEERPAKRRRLLKTNSLSSSSSADSAKGTSTSTETRSPADLAFARARMFYTRPVHVPNSEKLLAGLPSTHILHRLNPSFHRRTKAPLEEYTDPDPRAQAAGARRLAKYIFPRAHGLAHAFAPDAAARTATFKYPEWLDREEEIKAKGAGKTPKRVKPALDPLEKMVWRHGKCGYKPLRDMACPSKLKMEPSQPLDSSIILEMMSEQSMQLYSQCAPGIDTSVDSGGPSIVTHRISQTEREVKQKPRFAEFACNTGEVFRYAVLVTDAVIPASLWGSDFNYKLVKQHIKTFISARRYESITLHHVLQGFRTTDCAWLGPASSAQNNIRTSVSDSLKRREILEEFLFWYFDSFLLQLLKTNFYVTESSAFRKQVLYFRHDDWETLCRPLIDRLTSDTFRKLEQDEAKEMLRQRKLGFSFVRLLPKDTGVRPIVNLRRRKPNNPGTFVRPERSINQILQAAFQILAYEKKERPELLGVSIFGANETYTKLKTFKEWLMAASPAGKLPKLYFVKVDVQACFDTIEQTKLLQILREALTEDAYMVQRFGQMTPVAGKIRRTFRKEAMSEHEHPDFLSYAAELAAALRHTIFVDQVVYSYTKRKEVLELLEEHITENIVKIGNDYYQQVVGIPQGSVLSSLLCSYFYGDLEKNRLNFLDDPTAVMMRLIDDYLLVTTDLSKARKFLDIMNKGHPDYGCFISRDKTLTNFDHDAQIMNVTLPLQTDFPWCGYLINMKDLSISTDYSRFHSTYLQDSLTVERGRRPGAAFTQKMLQLAKHRSHIIFCDTKFNSFPVVYRNIYQNFVVSAMKMQRYIRIWGVSPKEKSVFVLNTIRQMIHYTFATIRTKASTTTAVANDACCDIKQSAVTWLGTHAFHAVLSRKPSAYAKILKSLAAELSRAQHRKESRQLCAVTREANALMAQLAF